MTPPQSFPPTTFPESHSTPAKFPQKFPQIPAERSKTHFPAKLPAKLPAATGIRGTDCLRQYASASGDVELKHPVDSILSVPAEHPLFCGLPGRAHRRFMLTPL
ncbi:hypothetical protein [Sphingomonas sp.]|uniref:hypothetical protein n=1 Tax=Sphingomonas sp. TaxID=28214 RepID=UPI003D6CFDF6